MMDKKYNVIIGLGSNVGKRRAMLATAKEVLQARGLHIIAASPIYHSPAMLPDNAPPEWDIPFLNQVIIAETALNPDRLLDCLREVELALGRMPRGVWGPREIDLDIIDYAEHICQSQRLTIPHPHMEKRDFVLLPLRDIAPNWVHPVTGANIATLIDALESIVSEKADA